MKKTLFYWTDRLQISPAERILIIILFSALLLIGSARMFWQPSNKFDNGHYEPIEAEFNRLSTIRYEEESRLSAQYYPQRETGTKEPKEAFVTTEEKPASVEADTAGSTVESDKININKADRYELIQLPGIGPVIAQRIIRYRDEHGAFETVEEIRNVHGIGPARLKQIKPIIKL